VISPLRSFEFLGGSILQLCSSPFDSRYRFAVDVSLLKGPSNRYEMAGGAKAYRQPSTLYPQAEERIH